MSAQLLVVTGPDKGRSFPLADGTTLQIGRSQATATKLSDPAVSRVHCEIEYDGQRAVLVNISTAGTLVNGKSVAQHDLRHGEVIRVGGTELRFALGSLQDAETVMQPATATAPRPQQAEKLTSLPNTTLAHFQIGKAVAKGGSGVVFEATDTRDGSRVALKVLEPSFGADDTEVQRFIRAMKTTLSLRHDNIIALHGAGKTGPFCWIAMEFVEGESMNQVIQRIGVAGMLDWKYGFRVAVHVARALEYAHAQSIVHRNVTPTNIMLRTADKQVLLGDLILAKALEGALAHQVTGQNQIVGDIVYMSPERTKGTGEIDGRSDIYGLGATVYALIAGRPPFTGTSLPEIITKIRSAEPEKPKKYQMGIPDLFQGTVLKMLAKRPEDRFATAKDLLTDLERVGRFAGVSV